MIALSICAKKWKLPLAIGLDDCHGVSRIWCRGCYTGCARSMSILCTPWIHPWLFWFIYQISLQCIMHSLMWKIMCTIKIGVLKLTVNAKGSPADGSNWSNWQIFWKTGRRCTCWVPTSLIPRLMHSYCNDRSMTTITLHKVSVYLSHLLIILGHPWT